MTLFRRTVSDSRTRTTWRFVLDNVIFTRMLFWLFGGEKKNRRVRAGQSKTSRKLYKGDRARAATAQRPNTHLERVQPRVQVGDVHPLAVDVVPVYVRTIDRYALVAVVGTRERRSRAARALVVFQAERRLVALRHFHAAGVQHVKGGEHFHAVIVPATADMTFIIKPFSSSSLYVAAFSKVSKTLLFFCFFVRILCRFKHFPCPLPTG